MDILGLLSRWVHIASVVFLLGGVIFARLVVYPALTAVADGERRKFGERMATGSRPWIMAAVLGILASGLYNLMTKAEPPRGYHMIFGIKMLLALHVFAVAFLLGKPGVDESKRSRWMSGIIVSGLIIVMLSGYLRWISL